MDLIPYLKSISESDWYLRATDEWLVKDMVSHLIGWEREVSKNFMTAWEKGIEPWFMKVDDYTEFNQKIYAEFKDWTPSALLDEFEKWTKDLDEQIEKVGKENLEKRRKEFDWVLDDGENEDENTDTGSHFGHHLDQIKRAVENK